MREKFTLLYIRIALIGFINFIAITSASAIHNKAFARPDNFGENTVFVEKSQNCDPPTLEIQAPNIICAGMSITLSAVSDGIAIYWYDSEASQTPIYNGFEFTTSELVETTSYWAEAVSAEGCYSDRLVITVSVTDQITPFFDLSDTYCQNATPEILPNVSDNGITGTWFPVVIDTTTAGTTVYTFIPDEGQCASVIEMTVQVIPPPELTAETPLVEICEGMVVDLYVTTNGELVNWYDSPDAEAPLFIGNPYNTPHLYENTSFWVQAWNDYGCTSERLEIVVIVKPLPELTLETSNITIGLGSSALLNASSPGNPIYWYDSQFTGTLIATGEQFETPPLLETTSYWVEAYNEQTDCASDRLEITVTVNEIPDTPEGENLQYFTEGATLADLSVSVSVIGELRWYADGELTQLLPETTVLTHGTTYYATQTVNGQESEPLAVTVQLQLGITGTDKEEFSYYPNPVKDILNLSGHTSKIESVEVFDISGRRMKTLKVNSENADIDMSHLKPGTYILSVKFTNNTSKTIKVQKK